MCLCVVGVDRVALEEVVDSISDKAVALTGSPEALAVSTAHALHVLIAPLTIHFGVPSLPSLRCALVKVSAPPQQPCVGYCDVCVVFNTNLRFPVLGEFSWLCHLENCGMPFLLQG